MPHMSVLYGSFGSDIKKAIIDEYQASPIADITFAINSFDLYLTNSPIESWQLKKQFLLDA